METNQKWETVYESESGTRSMQRMKVIGGWLYVDASRNWTEEYSAMSESRAMAFVPSPHEPVPRRDDQPHGSQAV